MSTRKKRQLGVKVSFRCTAQDLKGVDAMARLLGKERSEFLREFVHVCVSGSPTQAQEFLGGMVAAAMKGEATRMAREELRLRIDSQEDPEREAKALRRRVANLPDDPGRLSAAAWKGYKLDLVRRAEAYEAQAGGGKGGANARSGTS